MLMTEQAEVTEVQDSQAQADWARVKESGIGELMAGYNLALALSVLEQSGMARKLLSNGGCSRAGLLDGLDPAMGHGLLDYLSIRGVVSQRDDCVVPTERGRLLYALRKTTIEPVFGQIKYNRRVDRFMRRGRAAVHSELRLVAATHNLLKLHNHWIANTA